MNKEKVEKESRCAGKNAESKVAKPAKDAPAFYDPLVCTQIQVFLCKEKDSKTRAFAKVIINGQLMLTGVRVVFGSNGYFVSFPNDPYYKGEEYHSIYYPVERKFRDHIEQCVLEKYQELAGEDAVEVAVEDAVG